MPFFTPVLLSLALVAPPQGQASDPGQTPAHEETVLKLEQTWADAVRHRDYATCDRLMSAGSFFVDGQNRRLRIASKNVWLQLIRTYDVTDFSFDDARIRVYGDTAVVTLVATEHARVAAEERTVQYFITDIWRHEDGAWKLAERHSSRPNPIGRNGTD